MLYLEDCVEMIEHVPQDVRDRTTEVRELDLHVQNSMDSIASRTTDFFNSMKKSKVENPDSEFEGICAEYTKVLDNSTEKINIATQMEEQMQRHIRKIEAELNKFKWELEADNPGITEVLEQRSLQLDEVAQPATSATGRSANKSNRRAAVAGSGDLSLSLTPLVRGGSESAFFSQSVSRTGLVSPPNTSGPQNTSSVFSPEHSGFGGDHSLSYTSTPRPPGPSKNRHQSGSKGSVGAFAGQNRRHASASSVVLAATASIPVGLAAGEGQLDALGTAIATGATHVKKHKSKKRLKSSSGLTSSLAGMSMASALPHPSSSLVSGVDVPAQHSPGQVQQQQMAAAAAATDWNAAAVDASMDPNEADKRYCLCNQVSYGEMVACDHPACRIEWFHYPCVGLTSEPDGKWYCPNCAPLANSKQKKKHHHRSTVT